MLSKRSPLILTTAIIALLTNASYTALATDTAPTIEPLNKGIKLPEKKEFAADNSWIKNPQKTAAQEAATKAREQRLAEAKMMGSIARGKGNQEQTREEKPAALETKPEKATKPTPKVDSTPKASMPAVLSKPTWQELAKQRRAERLKREQMNTEKVEEKPVEQSTASQEAAQRAREERMAEAEKLGKQAATPKIQSPQSSALTNTPEIAAPQKTYITEEMLREFSSVWQKDGRADDTVERAALIFMDFSKKNNKGWTEEMCKRAAEHIINLEDLN